MAESMYGLECQKRCPELQSCASEFVIRRSLEPDNNITLEDIIREHVDAGTLPPSCQLGPVKGTLSSHPSSSREKDDIVQGATLKVDAWGDPISINCRQQGRPGFGVVRPVYK